jgi:hypothetical protein
MRLYRRKVRSQTKEANVKVELRNIESVRPYEENPRLNDQAVEAVAKSLTEFGFRQPIVVDLRLLRIRLSRERSYAPAGNHCGYDALLGDVCGGKAGLAPVRVDFHWKLDSREKRCLPAPSRGPGNPALSLAMMGGRGSRVYASERFSRDGFPPVLPSFFLLPSSFSSYLLSFYTESIYATNRLPLRSGENGHAGLRAFTAQRRPPSGTPLSPFLEVPLENYSH